MRTIQWYCRGPASVVAKSSQHRVDIQLVGCPKTCDGAGPTARVADNVAALADDNGRHTGSIHRIGHTIVAATPKISAVADIGAGVVSDSEPGLAQLPIADQAGGVIGRNTRQ